MKKYWRNLRLINKDAISAWIHKRRSLAPNKNYRSHNKNWTVMFAHIILLNINVELQTVT